jgi:hypothetical protein
MGNDQDLQEPFIRDQGRFRQQGPGGGEIRTALNSAGFAEQHSKIETSGQTKQQTNRSLAAVIR